MIKPDKFWDWMAARYSKQPIPDEASYQKKLDITRQYLKPHMNVMEFGCGTGSTAIVHAPRVKHILAIDTSPKMIAIASGKAEAGNIDNITFTCSTVDDVNIADQSLDVVMAHSILHLLANREQVISRVHGMLKPGGVFVTSTICMGDMSNFIKIIPPIGKFLGLILRVFTAGELEDNLTKAGFEIDHFWQPGKNKSVFIVAKKA